MLKLVFDFFNLELLAQYLSMRAMSLIKTVVNRPSDRVREKKENCAGFGRQIVR